jgi:hypothetical protein
LEFSLIFPAAITMREMIGPEYLNPLAIFLDKFARLTPLMLHYPFLALLGIPIGYIAEKRFFKFTHSQIIETPIGLSGDQSDKIAIENFKRKIHENRKRL